MCFITSQITDSTGSLVSRQAHQVDVYDAVIQAHIKQAYTHNFTLCAGIKNTTDTCR